MNVEGEVRDDKYERNQKGKRDSPGQHVRWPTHTCSRSSQRTRLTRSDRYKEGMKRR